MTDKQTPSKPTIAAVALALSFSMLHADMALAAKGRGRGGGGGVYLTTPDPTNPLEHNNRAVELGTKGLWDAAVHEHEVALDGDPENIMFRKNLSGAHLRYGELLASKKNFPAAIDQFRKALFADENNSPADNNLDRCLANLGKNPHDTGYRASLAEGADRSGHFIDAVVEYRKVVKLSDSGPSRYRLGRCLLKGGKVMEGYQELLNALRKSWSTQDNPTLIECHLLLAETLKDFAYKAKEYPDKTIYIKRLNNAYMEYRRAAMLMGDNINGEVISGLIETAREAAALQPTFRNFIALASAYLLGGDYDRAKLNYEKAWRAEPNNPDIVKARLAYHRAVATAPMGLTSNVRVAESEQKVQDLLSKDPNNVSLIYTLARLKEKLGDSAAAMELLEKGKSINAFLEPALVPYLNKMKGLDPDGKPMNQVGDGKTGATGPDGKPVAKPDEKAEAKAKAEAEAAKSYGKIEELINSGKMDDADKEIDTILNANAADGKAWMFKGTILEKKGNIDDASVSYRQAAGFKIPGADDALLRLESARVKPLLDEADKFLGEKKQVEAAELLREASRLAPKLPNVHRKLADLLKSMGETKEAEREEQKIRDLEKAK